MGSMHAIPACLHARVNTALPAKTSCKHKTSPRTGTPCSSGVAPALMQPTIAAAARLLSLRGAQGSTISSLPSLFAQPTRDPTRARSLLIMTRVPEEKEAQSWSIIRLPLIQMLLLIKFRGRLQENHMTTPNQNPASNPLRPTSSLSLSPPPGCRGNWRE